MYAEIRFVDAGMDDTKIVIQGPLTFSMGDHDFHLEAGDAYWEAGEDNF